MLYEVITHDENISRQDILAKGIVSEADYVLLAGLHQFGQFVVALLEQDINVGPGLGHIVFQAYQIVVNQYAIEQDVITSYSIHYTKLYDPAGECLRQTVEDGLNQISCVCIEHPVPLTRN